MTRAKLKDLKILGVLRHEKGLRVSRSQDGRNLSEKPRKRATSC
jgi:hypothetical protein